MQKQYKPCIGNYCEYQWTKSHNLVHGIAAECTSVLSKLVRSTPVILAKYTGYGYMTPPISSSIIL